MLDVSKSGTIASLTPITALTHLERLYLYGSTTIADGDLAPLLTMTRMHDLRMMNRLHDTPTLAQVRAHLGIEQ